MATFPHGQASLFLDTIYSPYDIYFLNWSISESIYASQGSIILPPNRYAFGDAVNDIDTQRYRLLVNLNGQDSDYGKIYAWYLLYDPLGEGDNKRGLGYVTDNLETFVEELVGENDLR